MKGGRGDEKVGLGSKCALQCQGRVIKAATGQMVGQTLGSHIYYALIRNYCMRTD